MIILKKSGPQKGFPGQEKKTLTAMRLAARYAQRVWVYFLEGGK